jgi:CheY-like chemotaxis protein
MAMIVVVEDQPDSLKLIVTLLKLRGHQVIGLPSGDHLVETVRAHEPRPELVLLDIQLPGRDGYALLGDLKKLEGDRPFRVVALTAHAMPADREKALAAGFDGYITKPIDIKAFPAEVSRQLAGGPDATGPGGEAA